MRGRRLVAGAVGLGAVVGAAIRGTTRRFAIREESMAPALLAGDWVIARRRAGNPQRGDIVVFPDPSATGMLLVKRVIGLPRERVGVEHGRVTINGALLADRWATGTTWPDGVWDIPADHVWVLGDNRARSTSDGRTFGAVGLRDVRWLVSARYWPKARIGLVP